MNDPTETQRRSALRKLPIILAFLVLAIVSTNLSSGASVTTDKAQAQRKLVILGASYAGSWGTPPLPDFSVVNRGVSGEQTKDMLSRFQRDVIAARPDVVLIWGHINNITRSDITNSTPERTEAVKKAAREDYLEMLKQARAAGIDVILATEIPLAEPSGLANDARALVGRLLGKRSYGDKVNGHVRDLNEYVRQLAAREQLHLLDFEKVFAPSGGARKLEFATEDRSHVTAAGYLTLTAYSVAELSKRR